MVAPSFFVIATLLYKNQSRQSAVYGKLSNGILKNSKKQGDWKAPSFSTQLYLYWKTFMQRVRKS